MCICKSQESTWYELQYVCKFKSIWVLICWRHWGVGNQKKTSGGVRGTLSITL